MTNQQERIQLLRERINAELATLDEYDLLSILHRVQAYKWKWCKV